MTRIRAGLGIVLLLAGCAGRGGSRPVPYPERLASDMKEAATGFLEQRLGGRQYLDVSRDRAAKIRRFHADPVWRSAAEKGDRDLDGVPDPYDRCADTPRLQPTDENGCPLPERPPCDQGYPRCGPSPEDDRRMRDLLDRVTFMINPRCDGSPVPQTPEPLEWGRGPQTPAGTMGFNLAVTEVTNQKPDCELFYEMELRVEWQAPPGQPKVRYLNVLFKASEDLKPEDPRRAVFGIPMPEEVPATPSRDALRRALSRFVNVRWRVRAVNGAQSMSPWSNVREQGPASGGVDG